MFIIRARARGLTLCNHLSAVTRPFSFLVPQNARSSTSAERSIGLIKFCKDSSRNKAVNKKGQLKNRGE